MAPTKTKAKTSAGEQVTRRAVIDAAVASILERGFYRASSNEIARRAGVTWGVIQHHFGTREKLMVAVLEAGNRRFAASMRDRTIEGDTAAERIESLIDILSQHYAAPEYLAYMQIALNLDHDPATSADVRSAMEAVAQESTEQVRALVRAALGPAAATPDVGTTVFLAVRGFLFGQQLLATMTHDTVNTGADRVRRQRRLLAQLLAPAIDEAAQP